MNALTKEKVKEVLEEIDRLLTESNISLAIYLFGGMGLGLQDTIKRPTVDLDFFMDYDDERLKEQVVELTQENFDVHCDIGVGLRFFLVGKRFAWVLPESAQKRARELKSLNEGLSNLKVYVLDPLDILILKCDRMEEQDIRDIEKILLQHDIPFAELERRFSEFYQLLEGDFISIENIRENFTQLIPYFHQVYSEIGEAIRIIERKFLAQKEFYKWFKVNQETKAPRLVQALKQIVYFEEYSKNLIEHHSLIASALGKILYEYKTGAVEELIDISDEQLHQSLIEIAGILKNGD